jgi:hypothetical protein
MAKPHSQKRGKDDEPIAVFKQRFAAFWSFMAVGAGQEGRKSEKIQLANGMILQKIWLISCFFHASPVY